MDDQSEIKERALLRFYSGESPSAICESLGISAGQLAEWEASTDPEELLPDGLEGSTQVLRLPSSGRSQRSFATTPSHEARRAVIATYDIARLVGAELATREHLLAGLMRVTNSAAARALVGQGAVIPEHLDFPLDVMADPAVASQIAGQVLAEDLLADVLHAASVLGSGCEFDTVDILTALALSENDAARQGLFAVFGLSPENMEELLRSAKRHRSQEAD